MGDKTMRYITLMMALAIGFIMVAGTAHASGDQQQQSGTIQEGLWTAGAALLVGSAAMTDGAQGSVDIKPEQNGDNIAFMIVDTNLSWNDYGDDGSGLVSPIDLPSASLPIGFDENGKPVFMFESGQLYTFTAEQPLVPVAPVIYEPLVTLISGFVIGYVGDKPISVNSLGQLYIPPALTKKYNPDPSAIGAP